MEYFRAYMVNIPAEAEDTCIVCATTPNARIGDLVQMGINSKLWHAYIVNYARSINGEWMLAETKALAMSLVYSDYLPTVHLQKQVSISELCQRCALTETYSEMVPVEGLVDTQVIGALTINVAILGKWRDLISSERVRVHDEGAQIDFRTYLLGNKINREKFYSAIELDGIAGGGILMKRMDVLNTIHNDTTRFERLAQIPFVDIWGVLPRGTRDNEAVINNGISKIFFKSAWIGVEHRDGRMTRHQGEFHAVMAQVKAYVNVDRSRSVVFPPRNQLRTDITFYNAICAALVEGRLGAVRTSRTVYMHQTYGIDDGDGIMPPGCRVGTMDYINMVKETYVDDDDYIRRYSPVNGMLVSRIPEVEIEEQMNILRDENKKKDQELVRMNDTAAQKITELGKQAEALIRDAVNRRDASDARANEMHEIAENLGRSLDRDKLTKENLRKQLGQCKWIIAEQERSKEVYAAAMQRAIDEMNKTKLSTEADRDAMRGAVNALEANMLAVRDSHNLLNEMSELIREIEISQERMGVG
jgi:hypothetical protein